MTEVNANDLTEITKIDDVFDLYKGSGNQAKAGIEIELAFFNFRSNNLKIMDFKQNKILKHNASKAFPKEDWLHNEPTSELLEIASKAYSFADAKKFLKEVNDKIQILSNKAKELGLKRSYFQELPERRFSEAVANIIDIERYRALFAPYRADMEEFVKYFMLCKSNQISVSPYNMDHMLENVRRLYVLAPFLFLLTDNNSGFSEGKAFSGHMGMQLRYNGISHGRSGVMPYVFTAQSGEEYITNHINHVMNNPLFMYYDREGNLIKVPSGNWDVTFNSLKDKGLNIASNYYLAQSVIWPDVKIAILTKDDGSVFGHRYEARMFGVGIHQHQTAYLITSALAFHDDFAANVDELLLRYGFDDSNLSQMHDLVLKSYDAARKHDGKFFDIKYGTGKMADFAKDFAELMEKVATDIGMEEQAKPMLTICRSGYTDGKVNRHLFSTLEDSLNFQRYYNPEIFNDPNKCALDVLPQEMARIDWGTCCAA